MNKFIVCILFYIFPGSFILYSQEPFKGATKINVTCNIYSDSLYTLVGNAFLDAGFEIKLSDARFKTLKAIHNNPDGYSFTLEVNIRIKDSTIFISGNALNGTGIYNFTYPLEFKKGEGVSYRGFIVMDRVAKSFPGKRLYLK